MNIDWRISRTIVSMLKDARKKHPEMTDTDLAHMINGFLNSELELRFKRTPMSKLMRA